MYFISWLVCTPLFSFQDLPIDLSAQMLLHTIVSYLQFTIVHNAFTVACLCCSQTVLGLRDLSNIFLEAY